MVTTSSERSAWMAAGADTAAKNTYASIQSALSDITSRRSVEVFLQGSYANSTNIRADSDVDIVVMTTITFMGERNRLGPLSQAKFDSLPRATFTADDLRTEVMRALVDYYGADRVHARNKCIRVDKTTGYVDADVVPCLQYRYYESGTLNIHTEFIEGISIVPVRGDRIINFPKEHIKKGVAKNRLCDGRYKPTVRQIKRLRNRAVDLHLLGPDDAPGYLLECMTYNVPAVEFIADDAQRLNDVALWLHLADKSQFMSCDGIHTLFGTDPGRFDVGLADRICKTLWDVV